MTLTWTPQTTESFDMVTGPTAGAHGALSAIKGCVPPNNTTGSGRWSYNTGYTLVVPGLYGVGQCISVPDAVTFTFPNADEHPGVRVRFAFTVDGFTGTRNLVSSIGPVTLKVTSGGVLQYNNAATGTTTNSSLVTFSAGVVYLVEVLVYIDTTDGAFRVNIDGNEDTSLTLSGVDTQGAGGGATSAAFDETNATFNLTVDNVRIDTSDDALSGPFDSGDCMTSPSVLPRMQTVTAIASGNYKNFVTCGDHTAADPFCAITSAASANNYLYVNDIPSDEKWSFLHTNPLNTRESWSMGNLLSEVGTIYHIESKCADWAGGGTQRDGHFIRISGTDYDHADNGNFEYLGVGAQINWSTRSWPLNPATSAAWSPSDFPLEMGLINSSDGVHNGDLEVTQVNLVIDYLATAAAGSDFLWTLPQLGVGW